MELYDCTCHSRCWLIVWCRNVESMLPDINVLNLAVWHLNDCAVWQCRVYDRFGGITGAVSQQCPEFSCGCCCNPNVGSVDGAGTHRADTSGHGGSNVLFPRVHFVCVLIFTYLLLATCKWWFTAFSALTLLVGHQEEHATCKNWVLRRWCGYLSVARCRLFAYGPGDATAFQNP